MDNENTEIESKEIDTKKEELKISKVSRARNRTIMFSADITGEVRDALAKEEKKIEKDDYVKPGQSRIKQGIVKHGLLDQAKEEITDKKLESQKAITKAKLEQQSTGLKFGKSVNRSRTTKITREELEDVLKPNAPKPVESVDGFNLPQPNVPKTFDPLTSLAPQNQGLSSAPRSQKPQNPIARKPRTRKPTRQDSILNSNTPSMQNNMKVQASSQQVSTDKNYTVQKNIVQATNSSAPMKGQSVIIGFLISYDDDRNGEVFQIRKGRKLITSRPTDHGEYMLIEHESVSPLHAILRTTKDNKIQIMDQLSEYGTAIIRSGTNEEIQVAGGLETVGNGDILRLSLIHI